MTGGEPFDVLMAFLKIEGEFSTDAKDPGNWTGGAVGKGEQKGTKYGISAAAYPQLDIKSLTWDQARAIYLRDYWTKAGCAQLPPRLALLTGDAAIQHGCDQAVKFLQRALGVKDDGSCGPVTVAAARSAVTEAAVDACLAERIKFYIKLPNQSTQDVNAGGWAKRCVAMAREVMT